MRYARKYGIGSSGGGRAVSAVHVYNSCKISRRMLSIVGERELRLHIESHVLSELHDPCLHILYIYSYTYIYAL